MKRALLATALFFALPSCTPPQSAGTVATQTTTAANEIYVASSHAGQVLVTNGQMTKARYQALDNAAYAVLLEVRAGRAQLSDLIAAANALAGK